MVDETSLAECVRDQAPGWESAWEMLAVDLIERLKRRLEPYRHQLPGGCADVDDLVGDALLLYQKRAAAGTLLRAWKPEAGSAVNFLSGRMLHFLALKKAKAGAGRGIGFESVPEMAGPPPTCDAPPGRDHIPAGGIRFKEPAQGKPGTVHGMAGIQLYPRVDWCCHPACAIEMLVGNYLERLDDWHTQLLAVHRDRRVALDDEHCQLTAEQWNEGRGIGRKRRAQQVKARLLRIAFEIDWSPIGAVYLMPMSGKTRNLTDQHLKRYRRALPEIIDGFRVGDGDGA